jgi:hypothetical protein
VWLPHLEHMALHANAQKRGPLPPEQHVQSRL